MHLKLSTLKPQQTKPFLNPLLLLLPLSSVHVHCINSVRDIQFKVLARCILHMVDVMPCIGGATVSLLDTPHVDFK